MGRQQRMERTRPAPVSPLRPQVEDVAVAADHRAPSPVAPAPEKDSGTSEGPESGSSVPPKYLTLERKETRLRREQVSALGELARELSARRRQRGERITENTLMRIAVDVLLEHAGELRGDTEDELRQSVSSGLPKSGTHGG